MDLQVGLNTTVFSSNLGSVADAFALLEGLEAVMAQNPDQTLKSCIKYAKQWRTGASYLN